MRLACKNPPKLRPIAGTFVALAALLAGPPSAKAEIVADFTLPDVNSTSSTYGQPVSPRDYLQQVSAWYFGHAT